MTQGVMIYGELSEGDHGELVAKRHHQLLLTKENKVPQDYSAFSAVVRLKDSRQLVLPLSLNTLNHSHSKTL